MDKEITFGKTIEEIINLDPQYLEWAVDNTGLELDEESLQQLSRKL